MAGQENHALFPSGEWEGFYTYALDSQADQHPMHLILSFKNGIITGAGSDEEGSFTWKGTYNKVQLECVLTKYYRSHSVFYTGQVDENGIWGIWRIDEVTGGFHIWPKTTPQNQQVEALEVKEESVREEVHLILPKAKSH